MRVVEAGQAKHVAYTKYKDYDGVAQQAERTSSTKDKTKNKLLEALRDRAYYSADQKVNRDTKVDILTELRLDEIDRSEKLPPQRKMPGTWNQYLINPASKLAICELRVSLANKVISTIRDGVERGAASHVWLSGLGCRIGEILALDWEKSIDIDLGLIHVKGTVIRIPGKGLFVQEHTKSIAGMRTLKPPQWVMDIFARRKKVAGSRWVFPSTTGTLRDPENTRRRIREVVKGTAFVGLHPHDFRHYVADALDRAGLTAREIADYLGHEQISTTQEDYMERGVVVVNAGPALVSCGAGARGKSGVKAGSRSRRSRL